MSSVGRVTDGGEEVDPSKVRLNPLQASHLGPEGPVQAVWDWHSAVNQGDYARAWLLCDANLRLARAQAWVFNNSMFAVVALYDRDALVATLAAADREHPLWEDFAETELNQMRTAYADFDEYGAASGARPVGADLEQVLFVKVGAEVVRYDQPTPVTAPHCLFLVRRTADGWCLAAHGDFEPVCGWPPQFTAE